MIKAILFDIGGVVTRVNFGAVYDQFGVSVGLGRGIVEKYFKDNFNDMLLGHVSLEGSWADMQKLGGRSDVSYEQMWLKAMMDNRVVNTELLGMINQLRGEYSVGVLSNLTFTRLIADEKINLYSNFDYTVLSCVEHLRKPDPLFYSLALKKAGVLPDEVVLIDDQVTNLDTAQDLGMHAILYSFPENIKLIKDFKKLGIEVPK